MTGGDEFADAVTDHRGGLDSPVTPEIGERVFDDEDRGLGEHGVLQFLRGGFEIGTFGGVEDFGETEADMGTQQLGAMIDRLAETRLALIEGAAHVDVLRALAGEKEIYGRIAALGDSADAGSRAEGFGERAQVSRGDGAAAAEGLASDRESPSGVGGLGLAGIRGEVRQIRRGGGEGFLVAGGEQEKLIRTRRGRRDDLGSLLENDVGVRSADPEGADPGAARFAVAPLGPGRELRVHVEGTVREIDFRIGRLIVQDGRQGRLLQRERRLDEAADARSHVEVPDVCLQRTEGAELILRDTGGAEGFRQGRHLDRITEWCAGAVALDVADRRGVDARVAMGHADDIDLALDAGCGVAVFHPAVVVHPRAADDGVDVVTVADRIAEAFQHHDAGAIAEDRSRGFLIVGAAVAVAREHALLGVEIASLEW